MRVYRSAWVVPVSAPPIADGAVAVRDGTIVEVGRASNFIPDPASPPRGRSGGGRTFPGHGAGEPEPPEPPQTAHPLGLEPIEIVELGAAVLLPGCVNAHTHLELSWMRDRPAPRGDFLSWVRAMIVRRAPDPALEEAAIRREIALMVAGGTVAVADVGNGTAALGPLSESPLAGWFLLELVGGSDADGERRLGEAVRLLESLPGAGAAGGPSEGFLRAGLAAHGPHSLPWPVLGRIAARARERGEPLSVHAAESAAEREFLLSGTGPFRALLESRGSFDPAWAPAGVSPVKALDLAGALGPRTLAVHCVHVDREDAALLASRGATAVLCPRSNAVLGTGTAPVGMLIEEGVRLAVGTDSLASNHDLDMLSELAFLRRVAPDCPPQVLVRAATLGGAEALGLGDMYGSLEPGKRAALLCVRRVPAPDRDATFVEREEEPWATIFAGGPGIVAQVLG